MLINNKSFLLMSVILFLLWGTCSSAQEPIQICTFEYPLFMSKTFIPGKGYGFLIDSTDASLDAIGLKANYHFFPMKRSILMAIDGNYDAFLGTIAHFPEDIRSQFSHIKMGELRFVFFYLKDEKKPDITFQKLEELKGHRIGTVRGSSSEHILVESGLKLEFAQDLETNIRKLLMGRIDLCVGLDLPAIHIIGQLNPSEQSRIVQIDKPIMIISVDFIIKNNRADSQDLFEKVEKGLERIKANGRYQEIADRYYGKKVL